VSLQVELAYGSPLHKRVADFVRERRKASLDKMKANHEKWDEADDAFRAYQPLSEIDAERKNKKRTQGTHDYVTITVPYTFAVIMTAHTYWSTVFLSRSPVYQLQGRHAETQDSTEAFEAVLDYQKTVGRHLVPLFNWIFDMTKYNLGVIGSYWDKDETVISRLVDQPYTLMGIPILGKTTKVWQQASLLKFEGNCLYNVRPYDWFPDPRVPISEFQKGEFCGRDTQVGWHEILDGQRQGRYFNIDVLANKINSGSYPGETSGSPRVELPEQAGDDLSKIPGPGFVRLHEMTARIIPSMWKLSPVGRTEKWVFTVANNDVVIGAQPQSLYHDEFPFDVMEFQPGAHEFSKLSLHEIMAPLVDTMSWLLNSHFYNVRKALNDVRVVDPSRIVMKDLTSPIERGIVRLKPEAYGTPANQAIHQLQTPDMTRTHLQDIAIMEQITQRVTGVVDELFGLASGPSRESATGVRTRTGFAANRLKTIAEYNSALGMAPLLGKLVSNTQQLLSTEQKYRIAGVDSMKYAKRFVDVTPDLIAGQYDYVPVDGTLPIDPLARANFWKELTIQLAQVPQLAMQWDLMEMISHIMRLQGEKNTGRFRLDLRNPQDLAQAVQAGNVVPIGGANERPRGTSGGTL
jgi:hypothetical protein